MSKFHVPKANVGEDITVRFRALGSSSFDAVHPPQVRHLSETNVGAPLLQSALLPSILEIGSSAWVCAVAMALCGPHRTREDQASNSNDDDFGGNRPVFISFTQLSSCGRVLM